MGAPGLFFEDRYKSIAILDEEALLSVCAYIDLNPVAAGIVALPEESPHTSIKERVEHVKATGRIADVSEIRNGGVAAAKVSDGLERDLWLIPIEDRRKLFKSCACPSVSMDAGHGGASGRYEALLEKSNEYAFLLDQMGVHNRLP